MAANSAVSNRRISRGCPTMTRETSRSRSSSVSKADSTVAVGVREV